MIHKIEIQIEGKNVDFIVIHEKNDKNNNRFVLARKVSKENEKFVLFLKNGGCVLEVAFY